MSGELIDMLKNWEARIDALEKGAAAVSHVLSTHKDAIQNLQNNLGLEMAKCDGVAHTAYRLLEMVARARGVTSEAILDEVRSKLQ